MPTADSDRASRVKAWRAASGALLRRGSRGGQQRARSGRPPRWLAWSALVGLAYLTACDGGNEKASTPTTVASASSPAAAAAGSANDIDRPTLVPEIGAVVWATEIAPDTNEPLEGVERFPADASTIYAVVPVSRIAAGSVLSATWTYNGVPLEGLDREVVFDASPGATTWVEFHLGLPAGETWPLGAYEIAISVDGQELRSAMVEVVESEESG